MTQEIKIYRVSGNYIKVHRKYEFNKLVRSVSEKNAVDKVLDVVSSQRIKRRKIKVTSVEIVPEDECDDVYINALAELQ